MSDALSIWSNEYVPVVAENSIGNYEANLRDIEIPIITEEYIYDNWSLSGGRPNMMDGNPLYKIHVDNVERWVECYGEFTLRLDYDLNPNSVVFDVGGYVGDWAASIYARHTCNVYVFEPVERFYRKLKLRFMGNPKFKLYNEGLGGSNRRMDVAMLDDASSFYRTSSIKQRATITDICFFIDKHKLEVIDLLKLNVEGGEFEILPRLIDSGYIKKIRNVQVQFHYFVPDARSKMESIRKKLALTHRPTYVFDYVWENWTLK